MIKTILNSTKNDDAKKQVSWFAFLGLGLSVMSILLIWWLAIAGIAFSARALLLTWHSGVVSKRVRYRVVASAGLIIGILDLSVYLLL